MKKPLGFWKILIWSLVTIVIVTSATIAFLPSILSTQWGTKTLVSLLNRQIPGSIAIDHLSLSWLGSQSIEDVTLKDPQGDVVISLEKASIDTSLLALVLGTTANSTNVALDNLNAALIVDQQGIATIEKSLSFEPSPSTTPPTTVFLDHVNVRFQEGEDQPLTLVVQGNTKQGASTGNFSINAHLGGVELKKLLDAHQDIPKLIQNTPEAQFHIAIDIANFPVALIDQLITYRHQEWTGALQEAIGDQLNLTVTQDATAKEISLLLKAEATHLQAAADFSLTELLSLTKPATIDLKLTPALFEQAASIIPQLSPWQLTAPASLTISLSDLQAPLSLFLQTSDTLDAAALAFTASADLQQTHLVKKQDKTKEITFLRLHGKSSASKESPKVDVSFIGDVSYESVPLRWDLALSFPNKFLLSDHHLSDILSETLGEVRLLGFPLNLLDSQLALWTGNTADFSCSLSHQKGKNLLTAQLTSDRVSTSPLQFTFDKQLQLVEPANIAIKIATEAFNTLDLPVKLQTPATATLVCQQFSLPLPETFADIDGLNLSKASTEATLTCSPVNLTEIPHIDQATISNIYIQLQAPSLWRPQISMTSTISQPNGCGLLCAVLGSSTTLSAQGSLLLGTETPIQDPTMAIGSFSLKLNSDITKLQLNGQLLSDHTIALISPSTIEYTVKAPALEALSGNKQQYLVSQQKPLKISLAASPIPFDWTPTSPVTISGALHIEDLSFAINSKGTPSWTTIQQTKGEWLINTDRGIASIDFSGFAGIDQRGLGKFTGYASIDNWSNKKGWDFSHVDLKGQISAQKLPMTMISMLAAKPELIPLIGTAIDISLETRLHFAQGPQGSFSLTIQSEHLEGSIDLNLDKEVSLNPKKSPASFRLTITPESYMALRNAIDPNHAGSFTLQEPANVNITIDKLKIPLQTSSPNYLHSAIAMDVSIDQLKGINQHTKEKVVLQGITGSLSSSDLSQQVSLNIDTKGHISDGTLTQLTLKGTIQQPFDDQGNLDKERLSLSFDAKGEALPITMLCTFACINPEINQQVETIFGHLLDLNVQAKLTNMRGPVYVDLRGKNGRILVDSTITDGVMLLNRNIEAHVVVTPELGTYVLQKWIPVVAGTIDASEPLKLTIDKQGFAVPLHNTTVENINIQSATLELGRVRFSDLSPLAKVLSLLTPSNASQLSVWLTPAYFSLTNGVLTLARVDMLINDYFPIASWGTVNFGKDSVHMTIGLSGAAIRNAFGVSGVPNSYMLQLPLKGSLNKASIDTRKATAKISAVVAQNQGSPQGVIIGTVIDIAAGGLQESPPPKPTTNPLPWASMLEDPEGTSNPIQETIQKPVEEIKKGASSLIKKIFK